MSCLECGTTHTPNPEGRLLAVEHYITWLADPDRTAAEILGTIAQVLEQMAHISEPVHDLRLRVLLLAERLSTAHIRRARIDANPATTGEGTPA